MGFDSGARGMAERNAIKIFTRNLQVVGKKNPANFNTTVTYAGSKGGYTYRQKHTMACDCHGLRFGFQNPLNLMGAGNAIDLKISLEILNGTGNPTFYPLTANGKQVFSVEPDQLVLTDEFPKSFKKGDVVYLRIFVSSPTNKWPVGPSLAAGATNAREGYLDGDYTNFPSTATARSNSTTYYNGTTNITGTPTVNNSWINPDTGINSADAVGYTACICLGKPSPTAKPFPVVAIIGDSISAATGANIDNTWGLNYGFMQMAVNNADGAWIFMGVNGQQTSNFIGTTSHNRKTLLEWCTHALTEYGVNDIQANSAGDTRITTFTTNLQEIYTECKARGLKVYQTIPVVRTNSTDGWTTTTNQTPFHNGFVPRAAGGNNTWQDLKSWIMGNSVTPGNGDPVISPPINLDGYFDVAAAVLTYNANNAPIWQVGMVMTSDSAGIHPSHAGHVAMAAVIPASAFAL